MNLTALLADIAKLPVDDRIWLVQEIWNSIAEEPGSIRLTEAQKAELDRRLADAEANPDDILSWEEVKASLRDRDRTASERNGRRDKA